MEVPTNGWFILKDTIKMDDLGVPLSPTGNLQIRKYHQV